MCGRVTQFSRWEEVARSLGAPAVAAAPRYNISPGTSLQCLRREQGRLLNEAIHWGFTPAWAAPEAGEAGHANARAEGIFDKPTFRDAARLRRCIVPVDGYYEWKTEGRMKLPYYFRAADGGALAFAGLWSLQVVPGGAPRRTLCLLTVAPNREAAEVHSRMPVLLAPEQRAEWLSERPLDAAAFAAFARTAPDRSLSLHRVSADVNRAGLDAPHLVEALKGATDQPDFLGDLLG